jgi:primosomal protein N' (replication factor Y)
MPLTSKKLYLGIAVTLPVKEIFSYAVPEHLIPIAEIGRRALVPFRNRDVIGYILRKDSGTEQKEIKEILDILDAEPLFNESLVPFFQWMADYYVFPIGMLIRSALPSGLNIAQFKSAKLTGKGMEAIKRLSPSSPEGKLLCWINNNPYKRLPVPLNLAYKLEKKGWVIIENHKEKAATRPLKRKYLRFREGVNLDSITGETERAFRAKNDVEFLKSLASSSKGLPLKEISARFDNGSYLARKWIKKGLIESYEERVFRDPVGNILVPSPVPSSLYDQQKEVLQTIKRRLERQEFSTCLLNGVTGSGKTEVYYRAVKHTIDMGRKAILMLPEIGLAVYTEGIFKSRLGQRVGMFHSGLSRGERYDQWMRMFRDEIDVVIGARSALFAPLSRLGLIIVDEEYDSSYKQEEGPRYQARDAAIVRGKIENALVILGSGTPSVQSFHNAATGRYQLLPMPERIDKRPMPDIEIVDMKKVCNGDRSDNILSPALKKAIEDNLVGRRQTILFLNRRGFSSVYLCRSCGEAVRCRNCDLTLTYHLKDNRLVCHYCGFSFKPPMKCPACGHERMRAYGFGTERLEKELGEMFPSARTGRFDRDSTRGKGQAFNILKKFNEGEIDILVGTQMITKGYDFPRVTLVGVISADLSLGFPDFRAGERTFQLLSQVAGRAGRGNLKGKVIVQAFNPDHYAIVAAKRHDYAYFFNREKELREQLGYPPFSYLACLRFQGKNQRDTQDTASKMGHEIESIIQRWPKKGKEIQVLGPAECPMSKLKNKYRWQILIKSKGTGLLHYLLKEMEGLSKNILRKKGVGIIIDVDPYQML